MQTISGVRGVFFYTIKPRAGAMISHGRIESIDSSIFFTKKEKIKIKRTAMIRSVL